MSIVLLCGYDHCGFCEEILIPFLGHKTLIFLPLLFWHAPLRGKNRRTLKSNKLSQLKHLKCQLALGYYPSVRLGKVCEKTDRPAMLAVKRLADFTFGGESVLIASKYQKQGSIPVRCVLPASVATTRYQYWGGGYVQRGE